MSVQTSSRVWDNIKTSTIKQSERLTLLALADKADKDGICWPWFDTSYDCLAAMVGVSRRSAIRLIDLLCKAGHIVKVEVTGRGKSNYFLVSIGLQQAEIDTLLAKMIAERDKVDSPEYAKKSDTDDTLYNRKSDTDDTNTETKRVTPVTPIIEKSDTDDTLLAKKSDTGVTPPIIKNPSLKESILTTSPNGEGDKSPPPDDKPKGYTVVQREVLELFGAKRFRTPAAADAVRELEKTYGSLEVKSAAEWCAKKQMNVGGAIVAMETMLKNKASGKPRASPNGRHKTLSPEQQVQLEKARAAGL